MLAGLLAAVVAALAFANGANDVSKGVAPLVGSGVAGYRAAIAWGTAWTAIGAALGAAFAGAMLTTFGAGLLAPGVTPGFAAAAAALVGTAAWVALATRTGLPVSTTHSLIGAVIGATLLAAGPEAIRWSALGGKVVLPLLLSPVVAFALTAGVAWALENLGGVTANSSDCLCVVPTPALALSARPGQPAVLLRQQPLHVTVTGSADACARAPAGTLRLTLGQGQWLTSAAVSLARGMNDAPKMVALGLAAAALLPSGTVQAPALFLTVAAGMVAGGLVAGRRVTHLLSEKVTTLDTGTGLAASAVTALLVSVGAVYGLPMSTTHVASGGLAGVGAQRGSLNRTTMGQMALAWVVTLPASAALAALAEFAARKLGA